MLDPVISNSLDGLIVDLYRTGPAVVPNSAVRERLIVGPNPFTVRSAG
jgi:hypothetical protein